MAFEVDRSSNFGDFQSNCGWSTLSLLVDRVIIGKTRRALDIREESGEFCSLPLSVKFIEREFLIEASVRNGHWKLQHMYRVEQLPDGKEYIALLFDRKIAGVDLGKLEVPLPSLPECCVLSDLASADDVRLEKEGYISVEREHDSPYFGLVRFRKGVYLSDIERELRATSPAERFPRYPFLP